MTFLQLLPLLAAAITANVALVFLVADRLSPRQAERGPSPLAAPAAAL